MLTPDQLAAIKSLNEKRKQQESLRGSTVISDIDHLLDEVTRLTRHNQRMSAALAQLSDKDNWAKVDYWFDDPGFTAIAPVWRVDSDPQQLAERALVEDG